MNLDRIISAGESDMVEFKEMVPSDSKKYVKTVVAFSNGSSGRIVFGVDDDSIILGSNLFYNHGIKRRFLMNRYNYTFQIFEPFLIGSIFSIFNTSGSS